MNYLVDPKIISIVLKKPEDSQEVKNYLDEYNERIVQITSDVIYKYLKEKEGMNDEQIEVEMKKFAQLGNESPAFMQSEVLTEIDQRIIQYNKQVYDDLEKYMTQEDMEQANSYIQSKVKETEDFMKKAKQAAREELKQIREEIVETQKQEESLNQKNQDTNQNSFASPPPASSIDTENTKSEVPAAPPKPQGIDPDSLQDPILN